MTMTILGARCVDCKLCVELCPAGAILPPSRSEGRPSTWIDPDRCTECLGHFARPRCVAHCRIGGIVPDFERPEDRPQLIAKWRAVAGEADFAYDYPDGLDPVEEPGAG